MALAPSLIPGFQYEVIDGPHTGEVVTIVDNTVVQRKVAVTMNGDPGTILPRQLANTPVGMVKQTGETVAAPDDDEVDTVDPEYMQKLHDLQWSAVHKPLTDPMDERLDDFRPPTDLLDLYKNRVMISGEKDVDVLLRFASQTYRNKNRGYPANLALKGDTQSGKTLLVMVLAILWAKMLGLPKPMPVFTLSGSAGITDFVMFGQPANYVDPKTGKARIVHLPGVVELFGQVGGILYIDEINAIAERFTTSLFPVLDKRHEFTNYGKAVEVNGLILPEKVTLPFNAWCIATYNEGYEGMVKLNRAVHQRFRHILWDYDENVERQLVTSENVLNIGKFFRTARKERKISQPVGTAVLEQFETDFHAFGVEMAVEIFLGLFDARERGPAKEILDARGIISGLHEEAKQAARNEAVEQSQNAPTHGAADMLADAIRDTEPF